MFYVSDFDPSGKQMPVSVARKMEFFGQQEGLADIKLMPIALTYEQVQQYSLPGVPTKPLDSRAAGFKEVGINSMPPLVQEGRKAAGYEVV